MRRIRLPPSRFPDLKQQITGSADTHAFGVVNAEPDL
jgi:hypothetical protein